MVKLNKEKGVLCLKELTELIEKAYRGTACGLGQSAGYRALQGQVLNYMKRQHALQPADAQLTGAMINNYIKSGLLPRANGKKYNKDHLVYLTAICSLKQVLSVGETDALLKLQPNLADAKGFYGEYLVKLEGAFHETARRLDEDNTKEQLAAAALQLAISSYAQKLACEKILDLLKEKQQPAKEKQSRKAGSK